jgi:hypothetical protein
MKNALAAIFLCFSSAAYCQQANGEVKEFSGVNVSNDELVTLSQFKNESGLVVIFRGNECAFDGYYTQRISELVHQYAGKIPILLVNPYLETPEAIDKMKMYSTVWGLGVPYVADKDQVIMEALGARKTPEAFVLRNTGGKFSVVYSGAIDDNPQLPAGVHQKHLQSAIDGLLSGQPGAFTSVRATGCTIRKK